MPRLSEYSKLLGGILVALILSLIPSSVQAHPQSPHVLCDDLDGRGQFCPLVYQAHQRLKDNYWTSWWATWAEEHEVLVEQRDFTGAWPYRNTVAFSNATGSVQDSILLLHEYAHLIDDYSLPHGETCSLDPWSHERVYFWTMLAAYTLGDKERAWAFYQKQTGYYYLAEYIPYQLTEPCRERGAVEVAPWGVTYTQLKVGLNWW